MDVNKTEMPSVMLTLQQYPDGMRLLKTIYKICNSGSDAEVRMNKDGSFKVYEVKKKIAG